MTDTISNTFDAAGLSSEQEQVLRCQAFDRKVAGYWAAYGAECSEGDEADDELFVTLQENIGVAFREVAWTPAPALCDVTAKIKILQHAMGEAWANARIEIMLASIAKDIEALGG
jgi:hypothetical protein